MAWPVPDRCYLMCVPTPQQASQAVSGVHRTQYNATLPPLLRFLFLRLLCPSLALFVFRCQLQLTLRTKPHVCCEIRCLGWRHQLCTTDSEERQHHWNVASLGRWERWISTVSRDCRELEGHEHLRAGTHTHAHTHTRTHSHMQLPLLPNLSRNAPCFFL